MADLLEHVDAEIAGLLARRLPILLEDGDPLVARTWADIEDGHADDGIGFRRLRIGRRNGCQGGKAQRSGKNGFERRRALANAWTWIPSRSAAFF